MQIIKTEETYLDLNQEKYCHNHKQHTEEKCIQFEMIWLMYYTQPDIKQIIHSMDSPFNLHFTPVVQ